ncbi:hypothetical protein DFQ27_008319 [Actinomortierella ambigua]|uniref:Exonuclease domain-containing protein n=1 Tax=Actinomortierella ambigua TaxID=1343610 RepID=A0A9P6PSX6_9FUNG|nr:hypothetical protein DFQ27_008319 [Actinomortierella ambigua]
MGKDKKRKSEKEHASTASKKHKEAALKLEAAEDSSSTSSTNSSPRPAFVEKTIKDDKDKKDKKKKKKSKDTKERRKSKKGSKADLSDSSDDGGNSDESDNESTDQDSSSATTELPQESNGSVQDESKGKADRKKKRAQIEGEHPPANGAGSAPISAIEARKKMKVESKNAFEALTLQQQDSQLSEDSQAGTPSSVASTSSTSVSASDNTDAQERRKLKRKQKKLQKELARKSQGDEGRPSFMISKNSGKIGLKDLRELVVYLLTETPTLPWIMVKNKFNIKKVLMLYVGGLDPEFFHIDSLSEEAEQPVAWVQKATSGPVCEMKRLQEFFDYLSVTRAGGDKFRIHSPMSTLLHVPLSNSEKLKREAAKLKIGKEQKKPEYYMLSLSDLKEAEFPLPSYLGNNEPLEEGWTETPKISKTTLEPIPKKILAMDCEMVRTTVGTELARVTIVDDKNETVYDELVMPENPVVDYLTQFSGMTPARLEGVTTRLAEVQKKFQEIVDYNTILVGHSLENDLRVLKTAHPFIVDTSKIYHHTRGPPYRPGLRWLAQKWLSRQIQAAGDKGHDSREDAVACMDLLRLKLAKGPEFGEFNQDQETIFSRLNRFNIPRSSALIDADSLAGHQATMTVKTNSDAEVVEALPKALAEHDFVFARLRSLELNHGKVPEATAETNREAESMIDSGRANRVASHEKAYATEAEICTGARIIDASIAQVVEMLPSGTALVITSGHGDHRQVSTMLARQKKFLQMYNTVALSAIPEEDRFLEPDVEALASAVNKAKNGVAFLMVKP